ncbi:MAG: efflux RND transporter permease subunit [Burkholderiaceae bacterium]
MGASGRIAARFQRNAITPLLALVLLLVGLFAASVTPREEEPQIDVTVANLLIPFPGASARDVESLVAGPAEQVLSGIVGLEHVYSVSRDSQALVTLQFKVGVSRNDALVRVQEMINANTDWLPAGPGVGAPVVKSRGIDDVPVSPPRSLVARRAVSAAMRSRAVGPEYRAGTQAGAGTRDVRIIGGPGRAVRVVGPGAFTGDRRVEVQPVARLTARGQPGNALRRRDPRRAQHPRRDRQLPGHCRGRGRVAGRGGGPAGSLLRIARIEYAPVPSRGYVWTMPVAASRPTRPGLQLAT